jgi:hypothetical protein
MSSYSTVILILPSVPRLRIASTCASQLCGGTSSGLLPLALLLFTSTEARKSKKLSWPTLRCNLKLYSQSDAGFQASTTPPFGRQKLRVWPLAPLWLSTLYSTPPLTCSDQPLLKERLKLRMLSPRFSSTRELAPGMSIR